MEFATVSADGKIEVPETLLKALGLEQGSRVMLKLQGHAIIISKEGEWQKLKGIAAGGPDLVEALMESRREDREREDKDC